MNYKNADIVDTPNRGRYIPIVLDWWNFDTNKMQQDKKAVVPTNIGKGIFCKVSDETFLTDRAPVIVLTDKSHSLQNIKQEFRTATEIEIELDASQLVDGASTFENLAKLVIIPEMDLASVAKFNQFFNSCKCLTDIANLHIADTYKSKILEGTRNFSCVAKKSSSEERVTISGKMPAYGVDSRKMFAGCSSLSSFQDFGMGNIARMDYMFAWCTSLPKTFPFAIDMGQVEWAYNTYITSSDFGSFVTTVTKSGASCTAKEIVLWSLVGCMFEGSSVENATITGCSQEFFNLLKQTKSPEARNTGSINILGPNSKGYNVNLTYRPTV